jgi:hypothetical protein
MATPSMDTQVSIPPSQSNIPSIMFLRPGNDDANSSPSRHSFKGLKLPSAIHTAASGSTQNTEPSPPTAEPRPAPTSTLIIVKMTGITGMRMKNRRNMRAAIIEIMIITTLTTKSYKFIKAVKCDMPAYTNAVEIAKAR